MSDKFRWLRGVLMVSPVPHRVMSRSLTGSVKQEMRRKLVFLCHCVCVRVPVCVCVPILLLDQIRKVIFLRITVKCRRTEGMKLGRAIMDQTRLAFCPPRGCVLKKSG